MPKSRPVTCVENGTPSPRRLSGAEAVVVIVIIAMAAALVTIAGMTLSVVLQLLVGAGLTAVLMVGLLTGTWAQGLRSTLRALLAPAA
ncbi:hypothetical protein [Streptomyces sp. NPDC050804]|uniref:hypothetical protein n=1 Tax=unclassified Streptomyces TaxID=2593676 RepID=UPI003417BE6E|nr:hypothetical protein OG214_22115 [Streptomyces sp. NBC_00872]